MVELERYIFEAVDIANNSVNVIQGCRGAVSGWEGSDLARKAPDMLGKGDQSEARTRTRHELLRGQRKVINLINGNVERYGDAMTRKVKGKSETLEPLADQGQGIEFSCAKFFDHMEQQFIWKMKERHLLSLLLVARNGGL
jgi:hypothetical protein